MVSVDELLITALELFSHCTVGRGYPEAMQIKSTASPSSADLLTDELTSIIVGGILSTVKGTTLISTSLLYLVFLSIIFSAMHL